MLCLALLLTLGATAAVAIPETASSVCGKFTPRSLALRHQFPSFI